MCCFNPTALFSVAGSHIFFLFFGSTLFFPRHRLPSPLSLSKPSPYLHSVGFPVLPGKWLGPFPSQSIRSPEHLYHCCIHTSCEASEWLGSFLSACHLHASATPQTNDLRISGVEPRHWYFLKLTRWFLCIASTGNHRSEVKSHLLSIQQPSGQF